MVVLFILLIIVCAAFMY
ncbi:MULTISPECIES: YjcZ family sporulation protein [unclassified Lysinibacillus]